MLLSTPIIKREAVSISSRDLIFFRRCLPLLVKRLKRTSLETRAVCFDVCVTDNTTTIAIATPKILIATSE
ncbi:hypothetical protein T4B_7575 [Trichinella pseudospiralis]|uniref:Uncharacterized protein n=2 Tax=Trichinella pseudospiralis TaxID=6337 RepID=A0A0V1FR72_TRIPS|nr:hypothetical protein T4D_13941 [Trichinella pseudospiralis]KRZ32566.1 hypothetical protein T4B_7575 [Trichinella pseudospiralis]